MRPPAPGPDVDGRAADAAGCASSHLPRRAAGVADTDPGRDPRHGDPRDGDPRDGVGARTQAQIDAEIAGLGEVPMYQPSAPEPPEPGRDPRPPSSPHSSDPVFAWLYRADRIDPDPDPERRPTGPATTDPTAVGSTTISALGFEDGGPETAPLRLDDLLGPREPTPDRSPRRSPASANTGVLPATTARQGRRAVAPPPRRRSAAPRRIAVVALVAVIAASLGSIIGYAGLGLIERGGVAGVGGQTSAEPSAPPSTPLGAVPGEVWAGPTGSLVGVGVVAGCVAAPARDGNGNQVRYDATNLLDQDPATAWRCDDDTAPSLTFIVPQGGQLAEVGLINGYTKTDGADDSGRYEEYPRVLQVRWHLPDGTTHDQQLRDGTTGLQTMKVPVVGPGTVRLEIVRLTNPGTASATRDAVVLSEVYLGAPVV